MTLKPAPETLDRYLPVLAGGAALAIYLRTLAPTLFGLDSAEFSVAAYTLGIPHGPGYAVYLLLAHLFTLLPIGDVGYRANLLSAMAGAGMVALAVSLARRLGAGALPALAGGLSLAFCYYTWSSAVMAEVYTLQTCFLAGSLLCLWQWRQSGRWGWLLPTVALAGLAVANSAATLLWWPGLAFLAWSGGSKHPSITWRRAALLAGVLLLSLLPLLYFPWRAAAHTPFIYAGEYDTAGIFHPLDLTSPPTLLWYLSGRQFSGLIFAHTRNLPDFLREMGKFMHQLWAAFLGIGLPLGVWGLWRLWQREGRLAAGLVLVALPHTLFFVTYGAPDKDTMFLPVLLVWALCLALGLEQVRLAWGTAGPWGAWVLLILPLMLVLVNFSYADVSQVWNHRDIAQARLAQAAPESIYIAAWGDAVAMHYLQLVDGERRDVTVVNVFFAPRDTLAGMVDQATASGRSVYTAFREPDWEAQYRFEPVPEGFVLHREP